MDSKSIQSLSQEDDPESILSQSWFNSESILINLSLKHLGRRGTWSSGLNLAGSSLSIFRIPAKYLSVCRRASWRATTPNRCCFAAQQPRTIGKGLQSNSSAGWALPEVFPVRAERAMPSYGTESHRQMVLQLFSHITNVHSPAFTSWHAWIQSFSTSL